jgi:hypothetical protein
MNSKSHSFLNLRQVLSLSIRQKSFGFRPHLLRVVPKDFFVLICAIHLGSGDFDVSILFLREHLRNYEDIPNLSPTQKMRSPGIADSIVNPVIQICVVITQALTMQTIQPHLPDFPLLIAIRLSKVDGMMNTRQDRRIEGYYAVGRHD